MIRIDAAIARAKEKGIKVRKLDLAAEMWPTATPQARRANMTNLCSGRTTRVEPEWVEKICRRCGCTADFLLGLSNE